MSEARKMQEVPYTITTEILLGPSEPLDEATLKWLSEKIEAEFIKALLGPYSAPPQTSFPPPARKTYGIIAWDNLTT